jgi:pimeloyl-ACP methyl ester carboxylesterase
MRRLIQAVFACAGLILVSQPVSAQTRLATEEFMVPANDPGIELYVRNKRPESMTAFSAEKTVVFVHGATYPSETAFDLKLDGVSWMEFIASRGFDVYMLDVRGYSRSTRPKEMSQPADQNPPIVSTEVASSDVGAVVEHVLKRRNIPKVNLIGWSWGTAIMGHYASTHADKVQRLVLYAPVWLRTTASLTTPEGKLGAYRTVQRSAALARWLTGVPEDKKATLIPAGWFDAWADATFATDPDGAKMNPPVIRAPNGVVKDGLDYWSAGKPLWDPAKLTMPTMLTLAEWDRDTPPYMAQTLFPLLVNAPAKRLVMYGEGTHSIIMEKNRMQLFNAVQDFLEEKLEANRS